LKGIEVGGQRQGQAPVGRDDRDAGGMPFGKAGEQFGFGEQLDSYSGSDPDCEFGL
jgi:hypothetical protein